MVTLANVYTILDVSIQQLAVGLAILLLLVALAWYVSWPAHRRQCRRPRADEALMLLARGRKPGPYASSPGTETHCPVLL